MSTLETQVGGRHYKTLTIQPVEFIHRNKIGYLEGNAIKYICRHRDKNGRQDIEKAMHYLQILLEMEYAEPAAPTEKIGGPDWSQAPEWARWWAVDADGLAWFYAEKPKKRKYFWDSDYGLLVEAGISLRPDWKQSLTQRPKP